MTIVLDNILSKLTLVSEFSWVSLIEISRRFSKKYPQDWDILVGPEYTPSSLKSAVEKIQAQLLEFKKDGYFESKGLSILDQFWKLGPTSLTTNLTKLEIDVPKSLFNSYKELASRLGCNLSEVVKVGLRFYLVNKKYQSLQVEDFLLLAIFKRYQTKTFSLDEFTKDFSDWEFLHLIDSTLETYCTSDGLLELVSDGNFRLKSNG